MEARSEVRDGMRIDWDVPVPMEDGRELRADVYRPAVPGRHPVILICGPYGKGLAFQDAFGLWAWSIRSRRSDWVGCAPRSASSTRSSPRRTVLITVMMKGSR